MIKLQKLVTLVVRAREELSEEFRNKVREAHPGHEIEFRDIDPRNAKETYELVRSAGDEVIVLLRPGPLIADLIKNGVPCIPIGPGGLQRIKSFSVELEPYQPQGT